MFVDFIHFSRRNCPIAKRRLTTVAGARPDWGGNAQDWGGGQLPPLAPCWLRHCFRQSVLNKILAPDVFDYGDSKSESWHRALRSIYGQQIALRTFFRN